VAEHDGRSVPVLNLQDNAPGSPQQILITANVIAPKANPNPGSLDYGTHTVNSTTVNNVTLSNPGLGTLTINSITLTGSNSADFAQTNNRGGPLAQNASCSVTVTFKPEVKGSRSATLKFTDNAPSSTQTVWLSGKGN
jgi:Abnormal spindle-like microcephaly-assoc'd, ASPM-SPD-2-Hydin